MMFSFTNWSRQTADLLGSPYAFLIAALVVVIWLISGPFFGFSDTWQLIINTGTTIVTFLMVFLIQNTQNREARATQLKLDEIIKATSTARNRLIDLEHCTDKELDQLQRQFEALRRREDGAA